MTALQWLQVVALYPLLEEWVFRAGLLAWVDRRFPPRVDGARFGGLSAAQWRHNGAVSLLFCAAHAWAWPWWHVALVFGPSLLLGWVWQRWQRLWPCVLLHAGMNVVGYGLLPAGL